MNIPTSTHYAAANPNNATYNDPSHLSSKLNGENLEEPSELREVFDDFVGQTFFKQMLSAMRKTVDKPAYFHGGRAEEVFQGQLDQVLSEHMTDATAGELTDPMFELYMLRRA